ncbi:MAG: hypothetical protein NC078_01725 [Ruminococcus sp.]|nr:hypothetical protein [Ruminococcus sp.]
MPFKKCPHQWLILEKLHVYNGGSYPYQIILLLTCSKCGKLKRIKF